MGLSNLLWEFYLGRILGKWEKNVKISDRRKELFYIGKGLRNEALREKVHKERKIQNRKGEKYPLDWPKGPNKYYRKSRAAELESEEYS